MIHFTRSNIITPDLKAECGSPYWDEITEWLGLVTCPACRIAAEQIAQTAEAIAWLNTKTGGVCLTRGNESDVPLFRRQDTPPTGTL